MPPKLRTEVRKEQIAHAALAIAAEYGVSGVTAKRVADHVGLAPSALYRHYPNRDAIITAVIDLIEQNVSELLASIATKKDPLAALESLLFGIAKFFQTQKALPLFFNSEEIWQSDCGHKERVSANFRRYSGVITSLLTRAKETGQIRADVDPWQATILFFGVYIPPALFSLRMPEAVDFPSQIKHNWACYLRALAA